MAVRILRGRWGWWGCVMYVCWFVVCVCIGVYVYMYVYHPEKRRKSSFCFPYQQHNSQQTTKTTQVWGAVVRDWLDEILPSNAHELCTGRVHISVLCLPYRRHHVRWVKEGGGRVVGLRAGCVCPHRSVLPPYIEK